jgi:hypothetical protein
MTNSTLVTILMSRKSAKTAGNQTPQEERSQIRKNMNDRTASRNIPTSGHNPEAKN